MPVFGPVKREVLIKCLRKCGFDGPYSGGKHQFMVKDNLTLMIPNPIKEKLVKSFCLGSFVKQESAEMNGKGYSPTIQSSAPRN